ncbi:hypothetical protein CRYUN_Cryun10bG0030800 [Craigia yunnanensis]
MDEIRETALANYAKLPQSQKQKARDFFRSLDKDRDGKIDFQEYITELNQLEKTGIANNSFFKDLDKDGNATLDFNEVMTLFYIVESGRFEFCVGCAVFLKGVYFTCVHCYNTSTADTFDLCCSCYQSNNFQHHDDATFVDNYMLLRSKKQQQAFPSPERASQNQSSQLHGSTKTKRTRMKKWAKRCGIAMVNLVQVTTGAIGIYQFGDEVAENLSESND